MISDSPQNILIQFSPATRRKLFRNNDVQRLEISSTAPISSNRLDPINSCFSTLSASLKSKLASTIRESSSSAYQQLWLKFASFVIEQYGHEKFSYLAVISYFESLIDSNYTVSSIPRNRASFHISLNRIFCRMK